MKIEFYKFSTSSQNWYYTSSKQPITYLSNVYMPIAISRNAIAGMENVATSNIEITGDLNNEFFKMCENSDLEEQINVIVYSKDNVSTKVIFNGILSKSSPTDSNHVLTFNSIFSQQGRNGTGVQIQASCPYVVYEYGCFKNKDDMKLTGIITSINDNVLIMDIAASKPDGWFSGGFIENSDGLPRFILNHIGNELTLTKSLNGLNTTDSFNIFAGCDRSTSTCNNKFDNIDNYGGRPQIPRINPYTIILS